MSTVTLDNKTILVTGVAGFIGSNLVKRIYQEAPSATVIGIDNMNAYYNVALKEFRLNELAKYPTFTFVKGNIADKALITELFEKYKPSVVVNLAAQAGVRYSITNPDAYVESNLVGFFNILEACRHCESLEHLVYASSSSVYGSNKKVPYSTDDKVVYTGPIDAYFDYKLGTLEYRSVRFETETLDKPNFQGNAAVNYTDRETPWTRIIEHKWFEFGKDENGDDLPKTIISREYSSEWKLGDEPYYPVNDAKNGLIYAKYKKLADAEEHVVFGGRLGEYKYYDMDQVIAAVLDKCEKEFAQNQGK